MKTIDILKEIVIDAMPELEASDIGPDSRLKEDLGMGSLELMLTAVSAEERFGFLFEDSASFETVGELCSYIENKMKG